MNKDHYQKSPSPEKLYSRFMQRIAHEPTDQQLQRWEDEGGVSLAEPDQTYLTTLSFTKKLRHYFLRMFKAMSGESENNLKPPQT